MEDNIDIPDASEFRKRILREDDLFNSRTTVFLVTNGLLLTAVGLSTNSFVSLLLSVLGLIVTAAWQLCSLQNWRVIRDLSIEYRKHYKADYIENIVQKAMFKPGWKRPTELIAKPLPWTFLITWLVMLIISSFSFGK